MVKYPKISAAPAAGRLILQCKIVRKCVENKGEVLEEGSVRSSFDTNVPLLGSGSAVLALDFFKQLSLRSSGSGTTRISYHMNDNLSKVSPAAG